MRADQVSPLFWLAFGLLSAFGSIKLGLGTFREPGPGLLAFLASIFICLMALVILFQSLVLKRGFLNKLSTLWEGASWHRPLAIGVTLIVYIFILERVGFLLTSLIMLFIILKLVEKLPWTRTIVISLSISVGTFLLFNKILKTTLPRGIFGF
ncbi:MAG: tripartite tricarboxylate transporter TctB family protein [bacterium]